MFAKWTNIAPTACFDVSKNLQKQVYRYDKPFLKYWKYTQTAYSVPLSWLQTEQKLIHCSGCHWNFNVAKGPMPLAGHLVTYAVACLQFFAKCCCNSLLFTCQFVLWFFPSLPASWCGLGKYWVGKYSTELFSVTVPGRGCSQGCHGYLLLML